MKAIHIGDGAYASVFQGNLCVTANHHDPTNATDVVYIGSSDVPLLRKFLDENFPELMEHPAT